MEARAAPSTHITSLDGLRAFSVMMVIFYHLSWTATAPSWLLPVLRLADGALGVRVFFCISGFLITYLMFIEKRSYGSLNISYFFARRVLRIMPVNYFFIAFLIILSHLTELKFDSCQILTAITYIKNYACRDWGDGHLWSLSVEEQYYLIWPFLVARLRTRPLALVAVLAALASPLSRALEYVIGHRVFIWLPSHTDALMIGSLAAMVLISRRDDVIAATSHWPTALRAGAFGLMIAPIWLTHNLWLGWLTVTLGPSVQALCATYLILSFALCQQGVFYRLLNSRPIVTMGLLSYSLYIWQQLFLISAESYGVDYSFTLEWPVNIIGMFLASVTSYYLLERPFIRARHLFHPSRRAAPICGNAA